MILKPEVQTMVNNAQMGDEKSILGTTVFYQSMMKQASSMGDSSLYNECRNEFEYWKNHMSKDYPSLYAFWQSKQQ